MWQVLQELFIERKKKFFLFLPSHPHKCGSSALFIGVSRVRVSGEGKLSPLTLTLTLPSHFRQESVLSGIPLMSEAKIPEKYSCLVPTGKHGYTNSIAMLHCLYNYAALSVQGSCHCRCQGAALLLALSEAAVFREFTYDVSIAMVYCRYTYAGLLVPDSWTFGTR